MTHWWEIAIENPVVVARPRAVAYYRHSAQDRHENAIPIQQDQVRGWAKDSGPRLSIARKQPRPLACNSSLLGRLTLHGRLSIFAAWERLAIENATIPANTAHERQG